MAVQAAFFSFLLIFKAVLKKFLQTILLLSFAFLFEVPNIFPPLREQTLILELLFLCHRFTNCFLICCHLYIFKLRLSRYNEINNRSLRIDNTSLFVNFIFSFLTRMKYWYSLSLKHVSREQRLFSLFYSFSFFSFYHWGFWWSISS